MENELKISNSAIPGSGLLGLPETVMPILDETPISPMAAMMAAINANVDLEKIEKMIELQQKWDALEAKKAFVHAMAEFKKIPIQITKDRMNKQYNSMYTSIGNLINTVLPKMSECGLSHRWTVDQVEDQIKITCIVTHERGHSESTWMQAPPDKSGAKNLIQQIKSTRTYLQAATFESAMGLASTDANLDNDGNGSDEEIVYIDDTQKNTIIDMIADCDIADSTDFLKWLGYESIAKIEKKSYSRAIAALKLKKQSKDKKEQKAAKKEGAAAQDK
jgi:hypothetical protein